MNDDDTPRVDDAADERDGSSRTSEPVEPELQDRKKTRSSRRARAGRSRSEFSPQVADLLVDIVASGGYLTTAIKADGTSAATVAKWRKQNPEFNARLDRAEAQCEARLVTLVHDAAPADWRGVGAGEVALAGALE
jgi:hypothetical protein